MAFLKGLERNPYARSKEAEQFGAAWDRPDGSWAVAAGVQPPPPVPFQAAPNPPAAQASLPQYQTPPPMASATPVAGTVFEAAAPPHTPPPLSPPVQQQTQTGFVPPAVPVPPQQSGTPFLLTPLGISIVGGALRLLLLIGACLPLPPKPKISTPS